MGYAYINSTRRLEDESNLSYLKRLIEGFEIGIYENMSHEDIIKKVFDVELSPTESRKRLYGCKMLINLIEEDKLSDMEGQEILQEIEEQTLKFQKEKVKFQDQRREHSKIVREWARAERVQEFIEMVADDIAKEKSLLPPSSHIVGSSNGQEEGVVLFSDWHAGLSSDNYWNDFDTPELKRRVRRLTDKVIEYGKKDGISKLHVFMLGDLVSGLIHVTTRINNTENIVEQTQLVAEILSEVLAEFASEFKEVLVYNVKGNHERVSARKAESIPRESFNNFIIWFIEARLREYENITIMENKYDEEIANGVICDKYDVLAVHGHRDRPNKIVENLSLMTGNIPKYIFVGHLHHNYSDEVHSVEVIGNPSLSGVDQYAKEIRRTSKPSQKFMIFNKEEGLVNTYSIRLDV